MGAALGCLKDEAAGQEQRSSGTAAKYAVKDVDAVKASPCESSKCPAPSESTEVDKGGKHHAALNKEPEAKQLEAKDVQEFSSVVEAPPSELIGNLLDPITGPACGLPYQVHYLGPPRPPCEDERLKTTKALERIDTEEDPEITSILKLASSIFKAPATLCALFDEKRVYITEEDGSVIPRGTFPWRWTLCGWSLAFKNPQILVIPDTHQDQRFAHNIKVTVSPGVRFYCGAPLIASNGHRLGTLCFADVKPRSFDAGSCMIMNNLSELVVRQLEKNIVLKAKTMDNQQLQAAYGCLQRTMDAFEHCVALIDTSSEAGWKIMYTNAAFTKLTGVERDKVLNQSLGQVFQSVDGATLPTQLLLGAVAKNRSGDVRKARLLNAATVKVFTLRFRPASKEALDDSTMAIGIPSFLPVADQGNNSQKYYFMTVDLANSGNPRSSISSTISSRFSSSYLSSTYSSSPDELEGLEMGHLLGKGTFGSVYYGTWFGTPVAVKIVQTDMKDVKTAGGASLEAVLSLQLRHPTIVSTLKCAVRKLGGGIMSGSVLKDVRDSVSSQQYVKADKQQGTSIADVGSPIPEDGILESHDHAPANNNAQGWAVIDYQSSDMEEVSGGFASAPHKSSEGHATSGDMFKSSPDLQDEGPAWNETWMIMEYADKGCLQDAIDRGWLLHKRSCLEGTPSMEAVTATALEIASALRYLHTNDVVHGDLSGWNIMLCSAGATATVGNRGFVAKVADFGLSRCLDVSKITTRNYGTLTHQPPETLVNGIVSKATDVYSYGVLLWQMYTGSRPWSGLTHAQIIMQVANKGAHLKWTDGVPAWYRDLADSCMHHDADQRPDFDGVIQTLERVQSGAADAGNVHTGTWN
mmetsp:Transcript_35206/g.78353  ORF Transcript_35206/g.78353 Transcript_35206/m.78353 type:complete len:865 (-) Transcript_35206:387-2981(-)|eukprot:CAMPEP_0202889702 /NCGR_PEP_ID=MMETSP1392-20130828/294_1 /ASSEMBLY_ACC=CAM_ASM_000868 /TAXON_ID=225041 /ORGANISM="Chlamydomonas chlamydogama, Strain SAG 11-48b" /LENGTH=864 /DNA_ID=CAMNT_0049573095 /DNA_START=208 /DNA_END=2802 /DNA_ORIENTATION=-